MVRTVMVPVYGMQVVAHAARTAIGIHPKTEDVYSGSAERSLSELHRNLKFFFEAVKLYGTLAVITLIGGLGGRTGLVLGLDFVVIAALGTVGTLTLRNRRDLGTEIIKKFHQLYNTADVAGIRAVADPTFVRGVPEEQQVEFTRAVSEKLGSVKGTSNVTWDARWSEPWSSQGTTISLIQITDFENGRVEESFAVHVVSGRGYLLGWSVMASGLRMRCDAGFRELVLT